MEKNQFETYKFHLEAQQGFTQRTIQKYVLCAKRFEHHLHKKGRTLLEAEQADVVAFSSTNPNHSTAQLRSTLSALRHFYKWAVADGHTIYDPTVNLPSIASMRTIILPQLAKQNTCLANKAQESKFLAASLLVLIGDHGLRRSEILALTLGDLQLGNGLIGIGATERHNFRLLKLTYNAACILQLYLSLRLKYSLVNLAVIDQNALVFVDNDGYPLTRRNFYIALKQAEERVVEHVLINVNHNHDI